MGDQLAESLFQEAQIGIFQEANEGQIDKSQGAQPLKKHEPESDQIDSCAFTRPQEELDFDQMENNELYDQQYEPEVDEEGTLIKQQQTYLSPYEAEYNEVIEQISLICRRIVWNSLPKNKDNKLQVNEDQIKELCPRIWALADNFSSQSQADKDKCFLQTLLKGSFSLLGIKNP